VYENKGTDDSLSDAKDDISARLHVILQGNAHILWEPSALLPQFERCGTILSLQNAERTGRNQNPVEPAGEKS
jgi:hypothetical protein